MYWCPEVCIYTQKSTWIWKVYLNYSICTWKVSILSYWHHTIIESRANRHSAVSAFSDGTPLPPPNNFLDSSSAELCNLQSSYQRNIDDCGVYMHFKLDNYKKLLLTQNSRIFNPKYWHIVFTNVNSIL